MGNVMNRVFDSSGPEGKVRGTPQQIIDKYNQLASDAQLSNDRVAAENFQQHAEHYQRLLSAAQKEQDARREQQEREQRERQQQRDDQRRERLDRQEAEANPDGADDQPDIVLEPDTDTGLVETPEQSPAPRAKRPRKPRAPKTDDAPVGTGEQPEAAE